MVLETEVAIGLASSVVTFVCFACSVVSTTKQYFRSPDGMLQENHELLSIAESFKRYNDGILSWLENTPRVIEKPDKAGKPQSSSKPNRQRTALTQGERTLIISARRCQRIAVEFITTLEKLRVSDSSGKWSCFFEALRTVWSKDKIEAKLSELRTAREDLLLNLLVVTSNRQLSAQESAQKENQNLSDAILGAIQALKVQIGEQVAELSASLGSAMLNDKEQFSLTYSARLQHNAGEFAQRVLNLAESSNAQRTTRLMLHSLDFPQREHRRKNICKAHEATFNWLFQRDHSAAKPWDDYVEWLTAQDGDNTLYWITGKAGSGKSTLMRYLVDDPRTIEFLQQWAASKRVAVASCFFWNPGKEKLQKSVEGLLRTLLRDLLIEMPGIADTLSQWRWQSYELGAAHLPSWTSMELLSAFEAALKGSQELANVCLFIDGLDEFEGDDKARGEIINLLTQASEYPHIKVCVSSRPWRIFETAFDTRPSLKLEDLNLDDIKQYVDKELVKNRAFQRFQQLDPSGCQELAYEVVTKALGVFLWVVLVVRELLIGLQNEDRITDLRRRLHTMPPDLKDYFGHMMHTLDEFYLEQANQLFQVAMQRDPVLSLLTYSFVHEEDPEYAMKLPVHDLVGEELSKRLEFMERRLNTLCKGLLEVHKTSGSSSFCSHSVEFLHRTVGEFLQSDVLEKMLKPDRNPFDVHTAMCKAYLAEIKSYPFQKEDKQPLFNFSEAVMSHARIYELEHQTSLMSILDELDRSLETQFNQYIKFGEHNSYWPNYYSVKNRRGEEIFYPNEWNNSFLTLAFWWGLYIYVKESIIKDPDRVRNKRGRALPDYFISRTDLSEQENDRITELKTLANIALGRRSDSAPSRRKFSIRRLLNYLMRNVF